MLVVLRSMLLNIEKLEASHDHIVRENDTLKASLDSAHNKIVDIENRERECLAELNKTKSMVECVETTNTMIRVDSERLKERSIKSEAYSRRMNLCFEGVEMGTNETNIQCRNKIYGILKEMGLENAESSIVIEHCHRDRKYKNQNHKSILVKFLSSRESRGIETP